MEKLKEKLGVLKDKLIGVKTIIIQKGNSLYQFTLLKYQEKPYLVIGILSAIGLLLLGLIVLIIVSVSHKDEVVVDQVGVVEEIHQNPELTDNEKIELCSNEANRMEKSAYDYTWEVGTTTNFSKDEESHQLKGVAQLQNEDSLLAQCTIESGRYRDTVVRVSFLPKEYYSYDKFLEYQKHCEGLGGEIKSRGGYGHGMIGSCGFSDGTTCDLRELYRGNCKN